MIWFDICIAVGVNTECGKK